MGGLDVEKAEDPQVMKIKNISAKLSEHFSDYVVVGRVKDGLVWRYSDRSFAIGALARLEQRIRMEDQMNAQGIFDDKEDGFKS